MRRSKLLLAAVVWMIATSIPSAAEPVVDALETAEWKSAFDTVESSRHDARVDRAPPERVEPPAERAEWMMPLGGFLVGVFIAWCRLRRPLGHE